MAFGIIIGVLVGLGTAFAVGPIRDFTKSRFEMSEQEAGMLSFGAMLLVGAIVVSLFTGGVSAFWLVLGGLLGAFRRRLFAFGKATISERSAAAKDTAENAMEDTTDAVEDTADAVKDTADSIMDDATEAANTAASKVS